MVRQNEILTINGQDFFWVSGQKSSNCMGWLAGLLMALP